MSEDNKSTSQFNNSKRKSHKKHYTVLPYFSTPIVYVLVSLIAIMPICFVLMNVAVTAVHSAQKTLTPDFCDITASSEYKPSTKSSGTAEIPKFSVSKKIGKIVCDGAGLNAGVYYGLNRVSLRYGAALNAKTALPGQSKTVQVFGYSSTAFKALKNVKKGDTISFETEWGTYTYSVTDCPECFRQRACFGKRFGRCVFFSKRQNAVCYGSACFRSFRKGGAVMSRKSHSSETKSVVIGRHFLSFVLFLVIAALSLTVFVRADCVDGKKYASIFTNEKYVQSLYGDVKQYAYDMCAQNGIPTDSVDEVITYDAVYNTVNAYAVGNFDNSQDYTKTTYEDRISELNTQLAQKTEDMIRQYKINTADNANKACKKFSNNICDYLKKQVVFEYTNQLQTVSNIGKIVLSVIAAVLAVGGAVLFAIIYTMGSKKYRGLRAISFSFIASGILQLILILGVQIIKTMKQLVIYPKYLCEAVLDYVNLCELHVLISACASFGVAIVLIALAWKLKRDHK